MSDTRIELEKIVDYLRMHFPDRVHAQVKYVSDIIGELSKEGINTIEDLEKLLAKYPANDYVPKLENEIGIRLSDVGVVRSLLVARKIDEINTIIDSWRPLPLKPETMRDSSPFVNIGSGISSYLMKSGNHIKILATNEGELEISYDELGNRIGIGLPYLRRLRGVLNASEISLHRRQKHNYSCDAKVEMKNVRHCFNILVVVKVVRRCLGLHHGDLMEQSVRQDVVWGLNGDD
jgi:hypothetical protein